MNVRAVVLSSLILSFAQFVPAQHCGGTERWAVKDGTDPAVQQIDFSNITPIQVSDLLSIHQPSIPNNNNSGDSRRNASVPDLSPSREMEERVLPSNG